MMQDMRAALGAVLPRRTAFGNPAREPRRWAATEQIHATA